MTAKHRIDRDKKIFVMFEDGFSPEKIGQQFELSKKMIYNILSAKGVVFSNVQRRQYK